jgi:hypothetical protein
MQCDMGILPSPSRKVSGKVSKLLKKNISCTLETTGPNNRESESPTTSWIPSGWDYPSRDHNIARYHLLKLQSRNMTWKSCDNACHLPRSQTSSSRTYSTAFGQSIMLSKPTN